MKEGGQGCSDWRGAEGPALPIARDRGRGGRGRPAVGGGRRRCGMAGLLPLCAAALLLLLAAGGAIPPPEEAARMARFVLHHCDWGALATLSAQEGLRGRPFANIFSLSDGPPGPFSGSGVPYLYLTDMEISVQDLEVSGGGGGGVSLQDPRWHRGVRAAGTNSGRRKGGSKRKSVRVANAAWRFSGLPALFHLGGRWWLEF